ncbi:MAG: diguanylate cyclase [Craterilacuibacter sp.]
MVRWRPGPIGRMALNMLLLAMSVMWLVDFFLGVMPDRQQFAQQVRERTAESLAIQVATLLQSGDLALLREALTEVKRRDGDIRSLAIRQSDGHLVAQAGNHRQLWQPLPGNRSTLTRVSVPLYRKGSQWGAVELVFHPVLPETLAGWLSYRPLQGAVLFCLLLGMVFYLFLRRSLHYLDPAAVVPERVRSAFDTLREAVLIIDHSGRIVLANQALRSLHPQADAGLTGQLLAKQGWLLAGLPPASAHWPWLLAMQTRQPIGGDELVIAQPHLREARRVIVNCSPIQDGSGKVRGCLISLSDVTALHESNHALRQTLSVLEASKAEIESKNAELFRLATRDPMTGCLNRRAFFEQFEPLFARHRQQNEPLVCIMCDIDHFKRFNDTHGHAVGDLVIKSVVKAIASGLREADLLCRYGGEEFCIVLPGQDLAQAMLIGERLRRAVEEQAGPGIRTVAGLRITMSFGVAVLDASVAGGEALIDQADQALYRSKEGGRNRVTAWQVRAETGVSL